jgi:FMN-dependent NADH-azoreductase
VNILHTDSSPLAGRSVSRDLSARIVAASQGGFYSTGKHARCDFQVPYLKEILAFMGIVDAVVLLAEGVNISPKKRAQALGQATQEIGATLSLLAAPFPIGEPINRSASDRMRSTS